MYSGEVLVVGLGSIGTRHVKNLLSLGVENISVLRRSSDKPRALAGTEYRTITDIDQAFSRNPSIVIIANPTSLHIEPIVNAVNIGATILIEVPLISSRRELGDLEELATSFEGNSSKPRFLMGHNIRFHPALDKIHSLVRENSLGTSLFSRAQFGEYLPDCHPWDDYRNRYEARADLGGGVVLTSIHEIDHAVWLFGPVKQVTCIARTRHLQMDCEDLAMVILEHESGVLSEIELDFVQRTYRRGLEVSFSEGLARWELRGSSVDIFHADRKSWEPVLDLTGFDFNQTYIDELKHLFSISKGETSINDLKSGIHVTKVALAALESSRSGRHIMIDKF